MDLNICSDSMSFVHSSATFSLLPTHSFRGVTVKIYRQKTLFKNSMKICKFIIRIPNLEKKKPSKGRMTEHKMKKNRMAERLYQKWTKEFLVLVKKKKKQTKKKNQDANRTEIENCQDFSLFQCFVCFIIKENLNLKKYTDAVVLWLVSLINRKMFGFFFAFEIKSLKICWFVWIWEEKNSSSMILHSLWL